MKTKSTVVILIVALLLIAGGVYQFVLKKSGGEEPIGEVRIGETTFINGVRITLNRVVQDSRCPVDVQCIRAGSVTVNVTLQSNTDEETRTIVSDEVPTPFDSYKISIEAIKPPRISDFEPLSGSYKLTFKVVSN